MVPLVTASLLLRRFTEEDAGTILALSQEVGVREWLPDQVYADEETAREVLGELIAGYDDPGGPSTVPVVLGVCLRGGGELIGHVGLSPAGGGVEIGYAIGDRHQGRGLATEAVRAMSDWGLERFALAAIDGVVAADNVASCRVLVGAGFALVGEATRRLHGVTRVVRTYRKR